jgi:hypothetical protein
VGIGVGDEGFNRPGGQWHTIRIAELLLGIGQELEDSH